MKRKYLLILFAIMIPFLCSVGVSSWIISETTNFKPEYGILDLIKECYDNQVVEYKVAESQKPTSTDTSILIDAVVYSKCTVQYSKAGANAYGNHEPSNAGTYDVKFTYKGKSIVVTFKINPLLINLESYGYTSTSVVLSAIIEGEQAASYTGGKVTNSSGTTVPGKITYDTTTLAYTTSTNTTEIISTTAIWTSNDGNSYCEIPATVTMHAVAYNSTSGNYYGTVEKALSGASSGNKIWVLGGIYTATKFYPTIKSNCEIKSGVELNLSYSSTDYSTGYLVAQGSNSGSNPGYLYIEEGVTVSNNGTLMVGACVTGSGSSIGTHAVLMNNGTINCSSGSNVYARGYIKGLGIINANPGSNVYQEFFVYDWPGGTNAKSFSGAKIFPFQVFGFTNITCGFKLYYNANLYGHCQINASDSWIMNDNIKLAGSGGLFELTGTSADYIYMTVEDTTKVTNCNTNLSFDNRDRTIRNVFEINGSFKDNSITVSVASAYKISTSQEMAMPIGFLKLLIQRGTGTLSVNSYKFLPGSALEIKQNASVTVGSGTHVIFYDETFEETYTHKSGGTVTTCPYYYQTNQSAWFTAHKGTETLGAQFICDGTFTCNGGFGGKINTTTETGKVILASNNASINICKTLVYESGLSGLLGGASASSSKDTKLPKMKLYTNSGVANKYNNVASGTYYSIKDNNNKYGWRTTSLVLSYDLNGGVGNTPSDSAEKTVGSSGYVIQSSDIPTIVPTREHYTFVGWALDLDGEELVEVGTTTVYASTTLYAAWEAIPYTITYNNVFYDTNDASLGNTLTTNPNVNTSNGKTTYTVADNPPLIFKNPTLLNANGNALVFGGWYSNPECTDEYLINTTQDIVGNVTVYAYWYPYGTKTVNVKFDLSIHDDVASIFPINDISLADQEAPFIGGVTTWKPTDYSSYNSNPSIQYYFEGWYLDSSYTTLYSSTAMNDTVATGVTSVTLYAKIMPKIKVTYANAPDNFTYSGGKPNDYWVMPNSSITLVTCMPINTEVFDTISNPNDVKYIYSFTGYSVNNGSSLYLNSLNVGDYDSHKTILLTPIYSVETYYLVTINASNLKSYSGITSEYYKAGSSFTFSITIKGGYVIGTYSVVVTIGSNSSTYSGGRINTSTHSISVNALSGPITIVNG